MSPLKVLSRGYSMTMLQDGRLIYSYKQVKRDQTISIRVSDGTIDAVVINSEEGEL